MLRMFKQKRYVMRFRKECQNISMLGYQWQEITDASLLSVLAKLQNKYHFEIVSYELKGSHAYCEITIKCNKADKEKIFIEYYTSLNGQITDLCF